MVEWAEQAEVESDIESKIEGDTPRKVALAITEAKANLEGIGVKAAFDPAALIAIINAIMSAIQNCQASAGARVAKARTHPHGWAAFILRRSLVKRFMEDSDSRKDARNWAEATMNAMRDADPGDVDQVIEHAEGRG